MKTQQSSTTGQIGMLLLAILRGENKHEEVKRALEISIGELVNRKVVARLTNCATLSEFNTHHDEKCIYNELSNVIDKTIVEGACTIVTDSSPETVTGSVIAIFTDNDDVLNTVCIEIGFGEQPSIGYIFDIKASTLGNMASPRSRPAIPLSPEMERFFDTSMVREVTVRDLPDVKSRSINEPLYVMSSKAVRELFPDGMSEREYFTLRGIALEAGWSDVQNHGQQILFIAKLANVG